MTKKIIAEAKANSDKKAYQELYMQIVAMLSNGFKGLDDTGQVYFNRAGMAVLFDIWGKFQRVANNTQTFKQEIALQQKEIHDLKREKAAIAHDLASVDVEYLQGAITSYKAALKKLLDEIRQDKAGKLGEELVYICTFSEKEIEQMVNELSEKGYLP